MATHIEEAEEIKEAARKIRDWCREHPCMECPFNHNIAGVKCELGSTHYKSPDDWIIV